MDKTLLNSASKDQLIDIIKSVKHRSNFMHQEIIREEINVSVKTTYRDHACNKKIRNTTQAYGIK